MNQRNWHDAFRRIMFSLCMVACWTQEGWTAALENTQETPGELKRLSLEQLGNVEVTTMSKEPEQVWRTPAAIYVITQEDIRRSGATNVPDVLLGNDVDRRWSPPHLLRFL